MRKWHKTCKSNQWQEIIKVENNCRAILSDFILQPTTDFFVGKNLTLRYWAVAIQKIYKNYTDKDLEKLLAQAKKVSGIEKFTPTDLHVAKLLHSSLWESFNYDNPTIISTTIATVTFLAFTTIATYLIKKAFRRRAKKRENEPEAYPMIKSKHKIQSLDETDRN